MADELSLLGLRVLPLLSGGAWLAIGLLRLRQRRFLSPLEAALTAFTFILGTWVVLDWARFGILESFPDAVAAGTSLVGVGLLSFAPALLLLVAKWLSFGHSRYDPALLAPPAAAFVWFALGGIVRVEREWFGVSVVLDTVHFTTWALVMLGYTGASVALLATFAGHWTEMDARVRRLFALIAASYLLLLAIGVAFALLLIFVSPEGVPWFSSTLVVPAAILLYALLPVKSEDLAALLRSVSRVGRRVSGAYLFLRDGTPLVALASTRSYEIDPERVQAILAAVQGFVETSIPSSRGYTVTGMRFEDEGVLAVTGQYVIAAAVYRGPAYDAVRSHLVRAVREFEEAHWRDLETWEGATRVAERAADMLSRLLGPAERVPLRK